MSVVTRESDSGRRLTGRTVLVILIAFFGLIFAVNIAFIYLAVSTFPGLAVESSYRAGQEFEKDVAEGRAQRERGWKVGGSVKPSGPDADVVFQFSDKTGAALSGLVVEVKLVHAVDPSHDCLVELAETGAGLYTASVADLPSGRWYLTVEASRDGERLFRSNNEIKLER